MRRFSLPLILLALSISATAALAAPVKLPHLSCDNSSNVPNTDLLTYDFAVQVNPSPTGTNTSSRPTPNLLVTLAPGSTNLIQLTKLVAGGQHVPICTLSSAGLSLSLRDVNFLKLEGVAIIDPTTNKSTNTVQLTLTYDAEQTFQSL